MSQEKTDRAVDGYYAATKIQATFKGFIARKNYAIKHLPKSELQDYKVLITGNDPKMNCLPHHEKDEQIALIGTSGMRSVEIACELSGGTPKLIILDNSKQVVEFWREARKLIANCNSQSDFLNSLSFYIDITQCDRMGLKNDELKYLEQLFNKYGFDRLKHIISGATVIAQSWADKDVINKIKNILALTEIQTVYAYPSNIVAYLYEDGEKANALQVLKNIQMLNPTLAIHTDLVFGRPENVFMIDDHDPKNVEDKLNLQSFKKPQAHLISLLDLLMDLHPMITPAPRSNSLFTLLALSLIMDASDENKEELQDSTDNFGFYKC